MQTDHKLSKGGILVAILVKAYLTCSNLGESLIEVIIIIVC